MQQRYFQAIVLASALCFSSFTYAAKVQKTDAAPSFKKVFIIVLENTDYEEAIQQPFLKQLSQEGVNLSNFYAESHPSQGNYIAMTAGSLHGVKWDWNVNLDVKHIGDLLEANGKTWKNYAEGYPGNCFLGSKKGKYYRKHTPFLSYKNVQKNPSRCANVVDEKQFDLDVKNKSLPDYSFYTPDQNNDGHDTSIKFADAWLAKKFGPLLKDPEFMKDLLFVVTLDESENSRTGGNHIYTILYGDSVNAGYDSAVRYDHFSLLRTIEDTLEIGSLDLQDAKATPINDVWK